MTVTDIIELSKSKKRVYIDNEFAFVLYKGELHKYGIILGEEIAEVDYQEIMENVLPKRAKLRAINLLQTKDYTEAALRTKLMQGEYPEDIIEEAISYVKSYHYIDDVRYAKDYLTYHEKDKSLRKIKDSLRQRGIRKEDIEKAIFLWEEEGGEMDECNMIQKFLEKKGYSEDWDYKEKCKIYNALLRKGFSSDSIQKMLSFT